MQHSTIRSFLILEIKRLLKFGKLSLLISISVVFLLLTFIGIHQYTDIKEEKQKFERSEEIMVERMVSYEHYSLNGVRAFYMPSPILIFFNNSSLFTELTGEVDIAGKVNLYTLFKGSKIFSQKSARYFDFSGLILLIGSLLALLYGFNGYRNQAYLKFLASLYGYRRVYWLTGLSRYILLCLYFLLMTILSTGFVLLHGITLPSTVIEHLLIFIFLVLLVLAFFFSIGSFIGSCRRSGMLWLFVFWFVLVYLIPSLINKGVEWSSGDIPQYYESVTDKLKIVNDFEAESIKIYQTQYQPQIKIQENKIRELVNANPDLKEFLALKRALGKLQRNQTAQKAIKTLEANILKNIKNTSVYQDWEKAANEKKKLEKQWADRYELILKKFNEVVMPAQDKIESKIKEGMVSHINIHRRWSIILPSTFYFAFNSEISSGGYQNIIEFNDRTKQLKNNFSEHILNKFDENQKYAKPDKKFYNDNKNVYIYYAKVQIPEFFIVGFFITILWTIFFQFWSYRYFRRSMFAAKKVAGLKPIKIDLDDGLSNIVLTREKNINNHLYNVLSGENTPEDGFDGEIRRAEKNITAGNEKLNFVHLCRGNQLPHDLKILDFALFISPQSGKKSTKEIFGDKKYNKCFHELNNDEERNTIFFEIIRKQLKEVEIFYFYDYIKGMPPYITQEFVNDLKNLRSDGKAIIYVTNNIIFARRIADFVVFRDEDQELISL